MKVICKTTVDAVTLGNLTDCKLSLSLKCVCRNCDVILGNFNESKLVSLDIGTGWMTDRILIGCHSFWLLY